MAKRDLPAAANLDERARLEIEFEQPYLLGPLFGDYDRHLVMIEDRLGVHVAARGSRVMIEGEPEAAARAREVLMGLYDRLDKGQDVDAARKRNPQQAADQGDIRTQQMGLDSQSGSTANQPGDDDQPAGGVADRGADRQAIPAERRNWP